MSPFPLVDLSCERITHFRCSDARCAQWWSISDFDIPPGRWPSRIIYCPRCGKGHWLDDRNEGVLAA